MQQDFFCPVIVAHTPDSILPNKLSQLVLVGPGFNVSHEPRHITEMRSVQTALRSNKQRPGYSTFACTGHKWEDDYLYHSCRSPDLSSVHIHFGACSKTCPCAVHAWLRTAS